MSKQKKKFLVSVTSGIRAWLVTNYFLYAKMEEQNSYGMIKLTLSHYSIWKCKMQKLLNIKDLFMHACIGKAKRKKKMYRPIG